MKFLSIIGLLILSSCIKESSTISTTIFTNTTSHDLNVVGYFNGEMHQESSFSLSANETKTVLNFNNRGIGKGLSFGEYYHPVDSFVVTFDDIFMMTHYKPTIIGNSLKSYKFDSRRNIFNDSNYSRIITKDHKFRREWNIRYSFIEQDYIDAR